MITIISVLKISRRRVDDAATRFLKASPPHLTLRMQFLDSKLYWFADLSCHTREYENKRFPTSSYALPMFFRCVDLWCSLAVAVPAKGQRHFKPIIEAIQFQAVNCRLVAQPTSIWWMSPLVTRPTLSFNFLVKRANCCLLLIYSTLFSFNLFTTGKIQRENDLFSWVIL